MKTTKWIWLTVAAAVFFIGWSVAAVEDMPGADGEALWTYITETSSYLEWGFWPDHEGMVDGKAPHGKKHKVYVNEIALKADTAPLPFGAIQVKENYNKKEKLKALTVMYKVEGFNPEAGDWFWVNYSVKGKVKKAGKIKGCIGCHAGWAKNDYVTVHELKK